MANATTIQLNLKAIGDFSDVTGDISQIQAMLNKIKVPQNLKNSFDGIFDELTKETTRYQKLLDSGFKKKGDVIGIESSGQRINNLLQRLKGEMGKIDPSILEKSFQVDPSKVQELQNQLTNLRTNLQNLMSSDPMAKLKQSASNAASELGKISKTKFTTDFTEAFNKGDIDAAAQALQNLQANHKKFNDESKENQFQKHLNDMKAALEQLSSTPALQEIIGQIRQTDQSLDNLDAQELERFIQAFQQGKTNVEGFTQGVRTFTNETNRAAGAQSQFSTEVDQLKSQVQYFFGMTNAVYLLRNALQSAFQTVKELDAVMTETAVVTDFTVGDMWEKLPEYTEQASALGASVKDLYSATTLYYQQGLKTDAAMGVGIETMKMARIASMDAAEATQAMTAALRGFNMTVNETNALRVNDVYSELAAITASDTEQIATAMSKTASIAAAANMEFETTAALLAQIIETTQEAPETAGTALKTIIARFSEVKSLQNKGEKTGEDEEGEAIDVNKIDKALKSVGISMEGFFAGTEGLDSILLKLAEKWDSLDFTTQRYIATMAAGSRQQSRFIAMMSDYSRTTELVGAANNSAGASQEQFNKTLESMEAKLAQLKNAWDEFTMGIADNGLLKAGIDLLTNLLNLINDITGVLPGTAGGIAKISILLLGLRAGGKIFDAFFLNLKACGAPAKALGKTITGLGVKIRAAFSKKNFAFDKDLFKAKAALSQYNREQNKANLAKTQSAAITKTDSAAIKEKATWDGIAANSTTNMAFAEKRYADALGLTIPQAQIAMGLEKAGISTDVAAALALDGVTAAELRELAVKKLGTGATEKDILATMKEIAIEKVGEKVRQKSLTTRIGETAQTLLNVLAKWGLVPANTAAAFSEKVLGNEAMKTGVKLLISLGIIGLIIAAVMLLIAGIVMLVNHFKNNTPAAKMKKLQEETKKAQEAAEEARASYDELTSGIDSYREAQEALDKLKKGTNGWKEQLLKTNETVLELIKNFPVLAGFMTTGESGQLAITEEGIDYATNFYGDQANTAATVAFLKKYEQDKAAADDSTTNNPMKMYATYKELQDDSGYQRKVASVYAHSSTVTGLYNRIYGEGGLMYTNPQALAPIGQRTYTKQSDGSATTDIPTKEGEYAIHKPNTTKRRDYIATSTNTGSDGYYTYEELATQTNVYHDALIELAKEYNVSADLIYDNLTYIKNTGATLEASKTALIAAASSAQVQASEYYSGILGSLGATLDTNAITTKVNTEAQDMWTNSDDSTNDVLKNKINAYNEKNPYSQIAVTGDEKADMAAYYKGLTGVEFDYEAAGKGADNQLAELIKDAEEAQVISDYVDELYQASVTYKEFGQLFSGNLDLTADLDQLKALAQTANLSTQAIAALEQQYKEIEFQRLNIDTQIAEIFGQDYKQGITVTLVGSYNQGQELLDSYNALVLTAGAQAGELFSQTFKTYANAEGFTPKGLIDEFSNIDWSSAIDGAAALKNMLENGSTAAIDFATSMVLLAPAAYSATAQFNELYDVIGAENLKELAKDGEITASELEELAKECDDIATVLDTTGMSASTMGTYFQLLEDDIISAADATDTFLQALEELNAAKNTISETFSYIDNFEISRSQTEIGEYFAGMQDEVLKLYDMGAYGDQRLIDYVKEFVGEENWGELVAKKGGDIKKALDEVMPTIKDYGTNLYGLWENFAKMDNGGMVSMGKGGAIDFNLANIGSVEELKQQLMDQLNISDTIAEAMIADAQTFSANLSQGLNALSLQDALGTWLSGALEVNGKKIISQSQLEAFAKEARLIPEKLEEAIGEAEIGIEIIPYLDENGNLEDDIYDMVIGQLQENGDLSATYALLLELGMDDSMAKQTLTQMTNQLQQTTTNLPLSVNGQELKATGNAVNGVLEYSTADGTKTGTLGGIIDGLQDPAIAAQQEISALQQGQIMGEATATGGIAATGAVLASAAGGLDGMVNSVVDWANTNLGWAGVSLGKSNLAGQVSSWTSGLMDTASATVNSHFSSKITSAQTRLNNANAGRTDTTDADIQSILDKYDGEIADTDGTESAYTDEDSQTKRETSGSNDPWENPYDYFYSLSREINETLRERERIERRYEKLLEKRKVVAKELSKNATDELQTLQKELALQKSLKLGRMQQITDFEKENSSMKKYAQVTTNEYGQLALRIDWDAINKVKDSDKGEEIEEYISQMEEWFDSLDEIEEGIWDIEDAVDEIRKRGQDEYFDLESTIKDALVSAREKEIDALSDISDSIEDTNSRLLEAMQKALDDYRQDRDNKEKEQELSDKQRRLAYLQQDTSGANAIEILELQEELDEETQDYTDELIDQKITELEDQNDQAAEQRERQIELMEAQLDHWVESGEIWDEVYGLMQTGLSEENGLVRGSQLETLLKDADTFSGLSNLEQMKWLDEINLQIAEALSYLKVGRQLEALQMEGEEVVFTNANGQTVTGKVDAQGNITTSNGEIYTDVYQGADGSFYTTETQDQAKKKYEDEQKAKEEPKKEEEKVEEPKTTNPYGKPSEYTKSVSYGMTGDKVKRVQHALNEMGYRTGKIDGIFGNNTKNAVMEFQRDAKTYGWNPDIGKPDGIVGPRTRKAFAFKKYVTGGLADFTGPAWLDGTKSKPEYILNSDQTKAFFQLVDVLSSLQSGGSKATEKTGDNTYDIDINVESIGSDYDVEQLANTVKRLINEDARYRNNNAINLMR